MKKIICVFLSCVVLFTALPLSAFAYSSTAPTSGSCGDNLTWSLDENGTLSISGEGEMYHYYAGSQPWSYVDEEGGEAIPPVKAIVIAEGVTSIGEQAFYGATELISVSIPNTVTHIGYNAFYNCNKLESITVPDSVTSVEFGTFYDCTSLKSITLGTLLTEIEPSTFYNCKNLESITIPDSVTSIGEFAFYGCEKLASVTFGGNSQLNFIGEGAFTNCTSLESITVPEGIASIEKSSFVGCTSLTSIAIPDRVTSIRKSAFSGCTQLANVSFGESSQLDSISGDAFSNCSSLKSINLPDSVTYIGLGAFAGSGLESISLPSGISSIEMYTFSGCNSLKSITLSDNITKIAAQAFYNCQSLQSIAMPGSLTYIGEYAFYNCTSLESISIPDGMHIIPTRAFYNCSSLESALLPETLTVIDQEAFYSCSSLAFVIFPSNLKSIGTSAFCYCDSLKSIVIPGSVAGGTSGGGSSGGGILIPLSGDALDNTPSQSLNSDMGIVGGGTVVVVGSTAGIGQTAFAHCSELESVILEDGVTGIGSGAFFNCEKLTRILIPNSVTFIGEDAFDSQATVYCKEGSYAEEYAQANGNPIAYGDILNQITVTVTTDSGKLLTNGYQIKWFEKGSDVLLAEGATLNSIEIGKAYEYLIVLDESTGMAYIAPERQEVTVAENSEKFLTLTYTLQSLPTITVTGRLTDSEGNALAGATVISKQTVNGAYTKTEQTQTDENGTYSITLAKSDAAITFSLPGYYNKTVFLSELSEQTASEYETEDEMMYVLPSDKITLHVSKLASTEYAGGTPLQSITSFEGLQFSLFNVTQGTEITDFTAQYPNIVIQDGRVQGGDVIRITVTDTQGTVTADPIEVTLSDRKVGAGDLILVENGKIKVADVVSTDKAIAMLFDESGRFVCSSAIEDSFTTTALPAGNYQLVLIQKTTLLRSISAIEKLAEMGLAENTDYIRKEVQVLSGIISVVGGVTVPKLDESRLYYTVGERTHFRASTPNVTLGRYLILRLEYVIDPKHQSSGEYITIELPSNVVFTANSLTFNGSSVPYSLNGNELKLFTNSPSGIIRFYVHAEAAGTHNVNAYLGFENEGAAVLQPIGTASFEAKADTISAPTKTGQKRVYASGTALPNSTVTVYDNDAAVGTVTANQNGRWSLEFDLVNPYAFSYHKIYATIANDRMGKEMQSETSILLFDSNYINLSKITMLYNGLEHVFDFISPKSIPSYYIYDSDCLSFTFKAEFTGGDDTTLRNVYVVTANAAGENTYIPVTYDAATNAWLGSYEFKRDTELPVAFNAVWEEQGQERTVGMKSINAMVADLEAQEYIDADLQELYQALIESGMTEEEFENAEYDLSALYDQSHENGGYTFESGEGVIGVSNANQSFKISTRTCEGLTEQALLEDGFTATPTDEGYAVYTKLEGDCSYYVDLTQNIYQVVEMSALADVAAVMRGMRAFSASRSSSAIEELREAIDSLSLSLSTCETFLQSIFGDLEEYIPVVKKEAGRQYQNWKKVGLLKKCPARTAAIANLRAFKDLKLLTAIFKQVNILGLILTVWDMIAQGKELISLYNQINYFDTKCQEQEDALVQIKNQIDSLARRLSIYYTFEIGSSLILIPGLLAGTVITGGLALGAALAALAAKTGICYLFNQTVESDLNCIKWDINDLDHLCEEPEEPKDPPLPEPPNPPQMLTPSIDPSGYVYEAVPSNRVEGVKVEAYYYDYPLDEFGMPKDEKEDLLWNATEYDQVNPLYTDKNGRYAWDVPAGLWLVKYSKEGYYDTDSRNDRAAVDGYLPVPPPQVEVNVGIVSKAAPTVASINAYKNEIQIIFSQYMKLGSIHASNVVFRQNGQVITGTLTPANAEYNYEGTEQFASIFTFVPSSAIEGTVDVEIKDVINYAGTASASTYTAQKAVAVKPESISLPETAEIDYGSRVTVPVQVLPAQAGKALTLVVTSSSPGIVAVEAATLTTDESGMASLALKGLLPGQSEITVQINGTDISVSKTVSVILKQRTEANKCEKVVSNIASGTVVAAGTQIILSTPTEGAEIYYTLDKTCPCIVGSPSRIRYTGPFTVTENVFIIAYAVKEGYEESATSQFSYTVQAACDHSQSTSKPDCEHAAVCSACGIEVAALGHNYAAAMSFGEAAHYRACTRCGNKKDEAAHSFVWVTDKQATKNEDGIKHEECTCGMKRNENTVILKAGADQTAVGIIVGIASLGAFIAAAVVLVFRKKRKKA